MVNIVKFLFDQGFGATHSEVRRMLRSGKVCVKGQVVDEMFYLDQTETNVPISIGKRFFTYNWKD